MFSAATFYAAAEFIIGLSAYAVPRLFRWVSGFCLRSGASDSFRYLFLSAIVLALSILPWCVFMGATFPLMMAYIRERNDSDHGQLQLSCMWRTCWARCAARF